MSQPVCALIEVASTSKNISATLFFALNISLRTNNFLESGNQK
jgi:hypothetical protein